MRLILHARSFHFVIAALFVVAAVVLLLRVNSNRDTDIITTTITTGTVQQIVSVSGVVNAENTADLAFPISDVVAEVLVDEGNEVAAGTVLAKLRQAELFAERQDALAALAIAQANRDELLAGPTSEERGVTSQTVAIATEALERVISEESDRVENARRTLLSSDLEALPIRADNNDTAPIVSGTYTCQSEGTYTLSVFGSGARSGYSYRSSGLEVTTASAYTESPAPLGTCGLSIQFIEGENYGSDDWSITIPNTRSANYTTNLNTYQLALTNQQNNVRAAEQALDLALREETLSNASPRTEALKRSNASVLQAESRLAVIDARIAERTLVAPFSGTITNVSVVPGESAGTAPVVTMVANDEFGLSARIPEIDITKIELSQTADVVFDARSSEVIQSNISFISPLAIEIDGVAYFEADLQFPEPPVWLRGGLNADIDIITAEVHDVLRVPKRFVLEENGATFILLHTPEQTPTQLPVDVIFTGNDGFIAITGASDGDIIQAP